MRYPKVKPMQFNIISSTSNRPLFKIYCKDSISTIHIKNKKNAPFNFQCVHLNNTIESGINAPIFPIKSSKIRSDTIERSGIILTA